MLLAELAIGTNPDQGLSCTCSVTLWLDSQANQVDKWVAQYRSHDNFSYIFRENARDVLNKQNPASVKAALKYLATLC